VEGKNPSVIIGMDRMIRTSRSGGIEKEKQTLMEDGISRTPRMHKTP
jgi:hypothetical protein